jgi:hypothetical protein
MNLMFLSDDLGNFASKSVLDDHLRSARDNLVSENLRMMLPSFFTKETGEVHSVRITLY